MSIAAMSIAEFCQNFGLSRFLVNSMIRSGQLAAVRAGRRVVIPSTAIDAWLKNSLIQPEAK